MLPQCKALVSLRYVTVTVTSVQLIKSVTSGDGAHPSTPRRCLPQQAAHPPWLTISGACLTGLMLLHSVNENYITGEGAEQLAKVVLAHSSLTNFGGIPMAALRENSVTELDLKEAGIGVPGALVLASLLPGASALKMCK